MTVTLRLVVGALAVGLAATAAAQPAPRASWGRRVALPLDGTPLDLSAALGPERTVTFVGSVSSRVDGSEVDARGRRVEGLPFEADAPFVFLPEGTEWLAADPPAHRYTVRLPPGEPAVVAFAVGRLAAQQLQTRSEAAASLHGRIDVLVHGAAHAPTAALEGPPQVDASIAPFEVGVLGFLALAPLGLLARRRRDSPRRALRRGRRALRAIDREARRLGPAFDGVVVASRALLDRADQMAAHRREVERASRRIVGVGEAAARRRAELEAEGRALDRKLAYLAAHLEGVAAELAAQVAGHARVRDLAARLGDLSSELEIAMEADGEVRAAT